MFLLTAVKLKTLPKWYALSQWFKLENIKSCFCQTFTIVENRIQMNLDRRKINIAVRKVVSHAQHSRDVYDDVNADINVIAKTFERVFNIDLGDFYHMFMELKSLKINRTKFLNSFRDTLIRKMEEEDER